MIGEVEVKPKEFWHGYNGRPPFTNLHGTGSHTLIRSSI